MGAVGVPAAARGAAVAARGVPLGCRGARRHARNHPLTVGRPPAQAANLFLPAVYCRDCGRSGWAVFSPESDDDALQFDTHRIRRASTSQDKVRVRALIAATDREAREDRPRAAPRGRLARTGGTLMVLDGPGGRLRPPDPAADYDADPTSRGWPHGTPRSCWSSSARTPTPPRRGLVPGLRGAQRDPLPRHRRRPRSPPRRSRSCSPAVSSTRPRRRQDADVQRLGAGRRAPGRVRGQPLVHVLAARAAHRSTWPRPARPR